MKKLNIGWKIYTITELIFICLLWSNIGLITITSAAKTISVNTNNNNNNNNNHNNSNTNVAKNECSKSSFIDSKNAIIDVINGDIIISILTKDSIPTRLIQHHLHKIIEHHDHNVTIGTRIVNILDVSMADNVLTEEIHYIEKCINRSLGVLISDELWTECENVIKSMGLKHVWRIPAATTLFYSKIAHILYELPWYKTNTSIDIETLSMNDEMEFLEAIHMEHFCIKEPTTTNNDNVIRIIIGDEAIRQANSLLQNTNDEDDDDNDDDEDNDDQSDNDDADIIDTTIFAIPFVIPLEKEIFDELPNGAFIFLENEIFPKTYENSNNNNNNNNRKRKPIVDKKYRPSTFLTISSILLDMNVWLYNELNKNRTIDDIIKRIQIWNDSQIAINSLEKLLIDLHLENLAEGFNLDLLQKYTPPAFIPSSSSSLTSAHHLHSSIHHTIQQPQQIELRQIASVNFFSNITTFYHYQMDKHQQQQQQNESTIKLGQIFYCSSATTELISIVFPTTMSSNSIEINDTPDDDNTNIIDESNHNKLLINEKDSQNDIEMYWRMKSESWIAAALTISILGVVISLSILIFITVRICMNDVLEGNPMSTLLLLIALIILFCSFIPFCIEYVIVGKLPIIDAIALQQYADVLNVQCSVKVFVITLCYCMVFSLLLCRAVMLASIGSEGGFLSHVNGYIQSIICSFSVMVQVGLSIQLLIFMNATRDSISCEDLYYGNWLWAMFAYDCCLLIFLVILIPYIFRSQRNYREGALILTGIILCLCVWSTWIPIATFGDWYRDIAVSLGALSTGWAILGGILIPRTFLIVRGIARSDLAQALPSLTSLAFANNNNCNNNNGNQYVSEQSIYECVNPAMRQRMSDDSYSELERNRCHSPGENPTLPLRTSRKSKLNTLNPYAHSEQSSMATPSKATRF